MNTFYKIVKLNFTTPCRGCADFLNIDKVASECQIVSP